MCFPELEWNDFESNTQINVSEIRRQTSSNRVTPSISSFINEIIRDDDPDETNLNYVRSLINYEQLNQISDARKAEDLRKKQLFDEYFSEITENEIKIEIKEMWRKNGHFDRKYITKKDRVAVLVKLTSQINERVQIQLADEFQTRYGQTQAY